MEPLRILANDEPSGSYEEHRKSIEELFGSGRLEISVDSLVKFGQPRVQRVLEPRDIGVGIDNPPVVLEFFEGFLRLQFHIIEPFLGGVSEL